jgi:hypothetical protein
MKISIAVSVLIIAIGATLGWQNQQQLAVAKVKHEKIAAEAAQKGIVLDPTRPANPIRTTKHPR